MPLIHPMLDFGIEIGALLRFATFRKLLVGAVERYYPPPLAIAVFVSPHSVIH